MMSSFMPALDPAAGTGLSLQAASPEATPGQSFSTLIQGLQPAPGVPAEILPATDLLAQPAVMPAPALPVSTEVLTDVTDLAAFLQELSLGQSSPLAKLDNAPTADADEIISSTDDHQEAATDLAVTLPQPSLLMSIAAPANITMMPVVLPSVSLQAQRDLAPAAVSDHSVDATDTGTADAEAGKVTLTLPVVMSALAPASMPASVVAAPVANGWQPLPLAAAFLNMSSPTSASASRLDDTLAPALDALSGSSTIDILKPASISFALPSGISSSAASSSAPVLTTLLPHAVQDPAWADAFGQRVALLAQQGTQSATLQLNPLDLGPIQVRIAMSEQGARVEFNTLQQTTSDLIESAMPRLAAALEHQGLRLDDSRVNLLSSRQDVFSAAPAFSARQDSPQSERQGERGQAAHQSGRALPDTAGDRDSQRLEARQNSLAGQQKNGIDYYA